MAPFSHRRRRRRNIDRSIITANKSRAVPMTTVPPPLRVTTTTTGSRKNVIPHIPHLMPKKRIATALLQCPLWFDQLGKIAIRTVLRIDATIGKREYRSNQKANGKSIYKSYIVLSLVVWLDVVGIVVQNAV